MSTDYGNKTAAEHIATAKQVADILLNRRTTKTGTREKLKKSVQQLKNDKEKKYKDVAGLLDFIEMPDSKYTGFATVSWLQPHLTDTYVIDMKKLTVLLSEHSGSDLQQNLFLGVLKEIAESAGNKTVKDVGNRGKMIEVLNHMVDNSSLFSAETTDTKTSLKTSIKKCELKPMAAEELGPLYKQVIESMAKVECSKELTNNFPQKQKHRKGGSEKQKAAVNAAVEKGFTAVKPKQTTKPRSSFIAEAKKQAEAAKADINAEKSDKAKRPSH